MNRLWLLVLVFLMSNLTSVAYAKNCKKGQPCGNSCISWSKTCHVGTSSQSYKSSTLYGANNSQSSGVKGTSEPTSENVQAFEVTVDKLNVRDKPNRNGYLLGSLLKGDRIEVITTSGDWKVFLYKNQVAWVLSVYLKPL
ncbi:SH3 domain-containing protein [Shewanella baltica]|uniref:SH3 domain-containing protein n=1 Tax=Shewanella baltica TaxID=62322 RepID=UPI00217D7F6A|nr:SH3 domain-containing protein [Shewanella baltica]MCS6119143.1 SH3 domain-containing protein [Shewanella baltica]MCS6178536.1 SH3 domain-containing protein [Shewanella baltica]MCS6208697.1 SH3 domain-containing protein [Shewanella baltica]MCS6254682.1 SH3 domain-containing protein [Shewanella baltica]